MKIILFIVIKFKGIFTLTVPRPKVANSAAESEGKPTA